MLHKPPETFEKTIVSLNGLVNWKAVARDTGCEEGCEMLQKGTFLKRPETGSPHLLSQPHRPTMDAVPYLAADSLPMALLWCAIVK